MSVGRLFHTRGAATANARSPNLLRVRGTYRAPRTRATVPSVILEQCIVSRWHRFYTVLYQMSTGVALILACQ